LELARYSAYSVHRTGFSAIDQIFRVIEEQSQPTFDKDFNFISFFNWTGGNGALSPAVNNEGNGEPKAYTGLVGTHHRPSDDLSTFGMSYALCSIEQSLNNARDFSVFDPGERHAQCRAYSSGRYSRCGASAQKYQHSS
jgi:hypothetical protein